MRGPDRSSMKHAEGGPWTSTCCFWGVSGKPRWASLSSVKGGQCEPILQAHAILSELGTVPLSPLSPGPGPSGRCHLRAGVQ